jgi:hypothetical protein
MLRVHVTEPVVYVQQVPVLPPEVLCLLRLHWRRKDRPFHVEEVCVFDSAEGHQIVDLAVERAANCDFDLIILTNHPPEYFNLGM